MIGHMGTYPIPDSLDLFKIVQLGPPGPVSKHEDVNRRTIEILQNTRIFKASHCLKVHNKSLKVASSISG